MSRLSLTARNVTARLALVALLVTATACGTEPAEESPDPPAAPPADSPEPAPPPEDDEDEADEPTAVTVTMIDNQFELDQDTFTAGRYTFVVEQQGQNPHALSIAGPGVNESTPQVPPGGDTVELTVTLEPGTYELWCPVPGHRQEGMELTIDVE